MGVAVACSWSMRSASGGGMSTGCWSRIRYALPVAAAELLRFHLDDAADGLAVKQDQSASNADPQRQRSLEQAALQLVFTGLFIWLRIGDQRQRSFVTGTGIGRPALRSTKTSEAVRVQTAVSAGLAVARRCVRGAYHGA
jgi:hypothetical protein